MAEQFFENGFPLASTLNVSKKLYEYAGRLMAMSLLQVGQNLTPEDYEVEPKFYIE